MTNPPSKPLVGIPVSLRSGNGGQGPQHLTADTYVRALVESTNVTPMLIPALGEASDFAAVVARLDGLMLTGGRANIEPHHYGAAPFPDDEIVDPERDATTLPLIRACVEGDIPVFGICRGIQEINVALGGTLHYRLHTLPGKMDHRMRRDVPREMRHDLRHPVSLTPGGLLAELVGAGEVMVIVGGVVPPGDYAMLKSVGVAAIFGPGTPVHEAAAQILGLLAQKRAAA